MEMIDRLPGVRAVVDDQAVSAFLDRFPAGDPGRRPADPAQKLIVGFPCLREATDMLFRDDQDVNRGPGIDIPESQNPVFPVDNLGRNFPVPDPAEKTLPVGVYLSFHNICIK